MKQYVRAWIEIASDPDSTWTIFIFTPSDQELARYQDSIHKQATHRLARLLRGTRTKPGRRHALRAEALLGAAEALGLRARENPGDKSAAATVLAALASTVLDDARKT